VGVTRVDTQEMYRSLTANVLSGDRPSQYSEQLLTRLGLHERFDEDPEVVLAALRGPGEGLSREYLFVLSELSFYHAVKSQKPSTSSPPPCTRGPSCWAGRTRRTSPADPRLRLAANLYNLGLAQGLEVGGRRHGRARTGLAVAALRPDRDQRGREDVSLVQLPHDAIHLPR
jgi:hypothetical protein